MWHGFFARRLATVKIAARNRRIRASAMQFLHGWTALKMSLDYSNV
jgi:hypothetical protein